MGCKKAAKSLAKSFNPVKQYKAVKGGITGLAQGKLGKGAKSLSGGDPVYQTLNTGHQSTKYVGKEALKNPYVAAGLTAAATIYGTPAAGAAVSTAAGYVQAKEAQKKAAKAQAQFEDDLANNLQAIPDAIGDLPGELAPILQEDEQDLADLEKQDRAARIVRRRDKRTRQRSLLETGLGGGAATVNRPALLGGA